MSFKFELTIDRTSIVDLEDEKLQNISMKGMYTLTQGSLSVSTHYTSNWTQLLVDIPLVSLALDSKNMELTFEEDKFN